ncbi:MAG TPA: hypothetical protein PK364_10140, partial [Synergistaceae bacterium]|nr:hypothetical protein [Synergistaceae bacterium]
ASQVIEDLNYRSRDPRKYRKGFMLGHISGVSGSHFWSSREAMIGFAGFKRLVMEERMAFFLPEGSLTSLKSLRFASSVSSQFSTYFVAAEVREGKRCVARGRRRFSKVPACLFPGSAKMPLRSFSDSAISSKSEGMGYSCSCNSDMKSVKRFAGGMSSESRIMAKISGFHCIREKAVMSAVTVFLMLESPSALRIPMKRFLRSN